ncbi:YbjQ family protein [Candidatus Woesearchaeota archaeon]|nr:YbjQ family protein [Candidatus Woesearchaeota archaeon]
MIITTTPDLPGKRITKTLGLVKGNIIRARWFGRDIAASLKTLIGGEIKSYTDLLTKARDEAISRMIAEAKKMKADAVVNVRFSTADVMQGAAEILAYGTAVKLKK